MNIEDLQNICRKLPGVREDIKWEHDLVFSVGGKMFCVVALDQWVHPKLSLAGGTPARAVSPPRRMSTDHN